ncbi:MAG: anti-sigma factor antagonist [Erysipelotrichaceae bacterium]|nr:anti-sigma factor antagonist [Erysipelotrichaceae bacterium]
MELIDVKKHENEFVVCLKGHIDSNNASEVEKEITEARAEQNGLPLVIDCSDLEYISSAGLRIILRLKKECPDLSVINVNSEVYEIFDITGFTQMMSISKAYRKVSIEGCEVIGQGANGKVYRIDPDTIVKVYYDSDSLPDIQRERELARTALILGIPTAIPYDVVKVGDSYGSVYELLNAKSFAQLIIEDPSRLDEVIGMSVDLLKKIHATEVNEGVMPDMKEVILNWADFLKDHLPEEQSAKLRKLIEEVPSDLHMLHGDYHIKNVMLQDDEVLLIDMDTLCTGHPIFEFASIFNAYQGYCELDHQNMMDFLGVSYEIGTEIWNKTLKLYFDGRSEEEILAIADKAKLIGYSRILRRTIRRNGYDTESGRALIGHCKNRIGELLESVDTLLY